MILETFIRKELIMFRNKFPEYDLKFACKRANTGTYHIKVTPDSILEEEKYCKEEALVWDKLEEKYPGERFLFLGKGKTIKKANWTLP